MRRESMIAAPAIRWGAFEWIAAAGYAIAAGALAAPHVAAIAAYGYGVAWLCGWIG